MNQKSKELADNEYRLQACLGTTVRIAGDHFYVEGILYLYKPMYVVEHNDNAGRGYGAKFRLEDVTGIYLPEDDDEIVIVFLA